MILRECEIEFINPQTEQKTVQSGRFHKWFHKANKGKSYQMAVVELENGLVKTFDIDKYELRFLLDKEIQLKSMQPTLEKMGVNPNEDNPFLINNLDRLNDAFGSSMNNGSVPSDDDVPF